MKKQTPKTIITHTLAVICAISALVINFIGLYMDPEGEIHTSLLYFYAISLFYSATLLGFTHILSSSVRSYLPPLR